ncbi:MAG TPA: AAA family ATPase [bacterium]|nr:AAA family ATPase [bacterium]
MEMLWPSVPAKHARHSLAQAITVIKSKVGPESVVAARNSVSLSAGSVDVDALSLDRGGCDVGGSFLDGFDIPGARGFEQWKDEWTSKLLPKIRDSLVHRMDAARRLGDFPTVERHALTLLQFDTLSEDGVRGVMEARAWVGDRSGALKAYETYVGQLGEVLSAQPTPEMVRMATLLREGRHSRRSSAVSEPYGRRERRMEAETIIGRTREFSLLFDNWIEIKKATPRVVIITGDAGIGKTTLTNTFLSSCQLEGAVVARVQAYDAERELPFAVLSELVRQLVVQRTIGGAEPEALAELARICSEVGTSFPGVPKAPDWAAEVIPIRLADALLKSVNAAADESPVVLVVDDVHAADSSSAAILHMLARKLSRARFMLILAGRPAELRQAAAGALVDDSSINALSTVEVGPLSDEAARELVTKLVQAATTHDAPVGRILEAGRGNPLALELLAREWVDHGPESLLRDVEAINTTPAPRIGIPTAVRNVFEREARRLDLAVRSVLDFAAVLGRRLHEVELYQAAGVTPIAASNALARLMEEGFLREVQGGLEFRNELIRAQAYYAIPASGREHLHRAAGEALSKSADKRGQTDLEIAWHFIRGRAIERAVAFGLSGAEGCLERGAPHEAEEVLKAIPVDVSGASPGASILLAQALLDQSKAEEATPLLDGLRLADSVKCGNQARIAAMRATAEYILARENGTKHSEAAEEAFRVAREVGDARLAARSLFLLARMHGEMGNEAGLRQTKIIVDGLHSLPEYAEQPMLHLAAGYCEFMDGSAKVAGTLAEKALALVETSGRQADQVTILNGIGVCRTHSGDLRGALGPLNRAYAMAIAHGDDGAACTAATNLSMVFNNLGEEDAAIRKGEESVALADRVLGHPRGILPLTNLASAYLLAERTALARDILDRAAAQIRGENHWEPRLVLLDQTACLALTLGRTDEALEHIANLIELTGSNPFPPNPGAFERLRIFHTFHTEGPKAAFERADIALRKFADKDLMFYLDAACSLAFVEKASARAYSLQTKKALGLLESLGFSGMKRHLKHQGFLS